MATQATDYLHNAPDPSDLHASVDYFVRKGNGENRDGNGDGLSQSPEEVLVDIAEGESGDKGKRGSTSTRASHGRSEAPSPR